MANENKKLLKISVLIFRPEEHLATDEGINNAVDWCKKTGVTHIFIGTWDVGRYTAEREVLEHARDRFKEEGFEVGALVVTKGIGKFRPPIWGGATCCYTRMDTKNQLQEIFEFTASIFDEIIIDDYFLIQCECDECKNARGGKTWSQYRCDLMTEVSRERILKPAKAVNPDVKVIIKYPLWHESFAYKGYDVIGEPAVYPQIWVGTESRDYDNSHPFWEGKPK